MFSHWIFVTSLSTGKEIECVIILTQEWLRRAAGKLHVANRVNYVVFCIFVGSWVMSDHLANEINQGPYYVKNFTLEYGSYKLITKVK